MFCTAQRTDVYLSPVVVHYRKSLFAEMSHSLCDSLTQYCKLFFVFFPGGGDRAVLLLSLLD